MTRLRRAALGLRTGLTCASAMLVALSLLVAPSAGAQETGKVYRIGFLSVRSGPTDTSQAFLQRLREFGYLERRHFVMEYRWAAGQSERLPALAADLVQGKVDLIVTAGTPATMAANEVTRTSPIVFGSAGSPEEKKLVASLAQPGGNVTGLALHVASTKPLQVLKEAVPGLSRVGLLYDPGTTAPEGYRRTFLAGLTADARALGLRIQPIPLSSPGQVERSFSEVGRSGVQGLLVDNASPILPVRERVCAGKATGSPHDRAGLGVCRCRVPHVLRRDAGANVPAGRSLRRQDSQGR